MKFTTSVLALAGLASAAELTLVPEFGDNPSGALMYIYVPDTLGADPAIIVAVHYCTGTAQAYYQGTQYAALAEANNYIVIYPESPYEGGCWDVSSDATLTRGGGGSSTAIANMVQYTLDEYAADASRVFVAGTSSGAMMTVSHGYWARSTEHWLTRQNVLAATYPDVFAAGSANAGVPASCFYTGTVAGWNSTCSGGQVVQSSEAWAAVVRGMYPGYNGTYPRMRISHGDQDTTLAFPNYGETIKQWAGIFGLDAESPQETLENDPEAGFTTYVYGEKLVGIVGLGVGHNMPVNVPEDLEWFGFV